MKFNSSPNKYILKLYILGKTVSVAFLCFWVTTWPEYNLQAKITSTVPTSSRSQVHSVTHLPLCPLLPSSCLGAKNWECIFHMHSEVLQDPSLFHICAQAFYHSVPMCRWMTCICALQINMSPVPSFHFRRSYQSLLSHLFYKQRTAHTSNM